VDDPRGNFPIEIYNFVTVVSKHLAPLIGNALIQEKFEDWPRTASRGDAVLATLNRGVNVRFSQVSDTLSKFLQQRIIFNEMKDRRTGMRVPGDDDEACASAMR